MANATALPGPLWAVEAAGSESPVDLAPFGQGEKKRYRLKIVHPYRFDLKTIQKAMAALTYQKKRIAWSGRKRVFSAKAIQVLAPRIQNKFAQATPGQRVTFQLKGKSGDTWVRGDAFLTPQGLHWRINGIRGSVREPDDFSIMGDTWRLVPQKGQAYEQQERYQGLVQDITNWVIIKTIRPVRSRVLKVPPKPKKRDMLAPRPASPGIKERLKLLEELRRDQLITGEEYRQKRREILNSL